MATPKEAYLRLSEETRQKIEETVVALYANQPYNEVTARLICRTLKINSATLYRWFESKDDLYIYLMEKLYQKGAFPEDLIWDLDDFLVQEISQDDAYTENEKQFLLGWTQLPEPVMIKLVFGGVFSEEKLIRNNLVRMQRSGAVRADIDVDLTAYIYNTINYNIQRYINERGIEDPEEVGRIQHYVYYELLRLGIKGHYDENKGKESMDD